MNDYECRARASIKSFPPLSTATLSIIKLITDPDFDLKQLVKLIETDLTLASRCLQVINSPLFGLKSRVTEIQRAVTLLGARTVGEIAIQTGMKGLFAGAMDGYQSTSQELWSHCLRTAIAARLVAKEILNDSSPEIAYTVGLFHDMGKLIISTLLQEVSEPLAELMLQKNQSFELTELELLGINHAIVGEMIGKKWLLPEALCMAILHHHQPSQAPESAQKLALAVHLGDLFAIMAGQGTGLDNMTYKIDPIVNQFIKRDATWELRTFPKLLLDIDNEFAKALEISGQSGGDHV